MKSGVCSPRRFRSEASRRFLLGCAPLERRILYYLRKDQWGAAIKSKEQKRNQKRSLESSRANARSPLAGHSPARDARAYMPPKSPAGHRLLPPFSVCGVLRMLRRWLLRFCAGHHTPTGDNPSWLRQSGRRCPAFRALEAFRRSLAAPVKATLPFVLFCWQPVGVVSPCGVVCLPPLLRRWLLRLLRQTHDTWRHSRTPLRSVLAAPGSLSRSTHFRYASRQQ